MNYVLILLIVVALLVLSVRMAEAAFNRQVKQESMMLYKEQSLLSRKIVLESDLDGLPPAVKQWLVYSQVVGRNMIQTAYSRQRLQLRLQKDKPWLSAEAEQYFRINEPAFIWKVKVRLPFLTLTGRDNYLNGHGHMLIKLLSLFKVVDASGPEIDQGTLLRYLGESVWYPSAALQPYI